MSRRTPGLAVALSHVYQPPHHGIQTCGAKSQHRGAVIVKL